MVLLDSSALLALIQLERGGDVVEAALATGAALSAVNLAEVVARLVPRLARGHAGACERVRQLDLPVLPLGRDIAEQAAALIATHRGILSLGDAICLATARDRNLPVLTADRVWAGLGLDVEVRLIR